MQLKYILLSFALLTGFAAGAQGFGAPVGSNAKLPEPSQDTNGVYNFVQHRPMFGNGYNDVKAYLAAHVHYPDSAKALRIQGKVFIKFVVNEDGSLSDFKMIRGVSKELDDEAMRVIKEMPKWKPGMQNGKTVKVYFTVPVEFYL